MHIVSRKKLLELAEIHADPADSLDAWYWVAKSIETEAENEAAIILAESLEHRQRTPEEDALLELLIILIEKFEEASYSMPSVDCIN